MFKNPKILTFTTLYRYSNYKVTTISASKMCVVRLQASHSRLSVRDLLFFVRTFRAQGGLEKEKSL